MQEVPGYEPSSTEDEKTQRSMQNADISHFSNEEILKRYEESEERARADIAARNRGERPQVEHRTIEDHLLYCKEGLAEIMGASASESTYQLPRHQQNADYQTRLQAIQTLLPQINHDLH